MKKILYTLGFLLAFPAVSQAVVINFDFTGRLIVADPKLEIVTNGGNTFTDIAATLSYDTISGIGGSDLSITLDPAGFLGVSPIFHDISMTRLGSSNFIEGQILVDWGGLVNANMHVIWDATGLFNAIAYGLVVGNVLSGSDLYNDTNNSGVQDPGEFLTDISSAIPYSDFLDHGGFSPTLGGPAPLAATIDSLGISGAGSLNDFKGYFDIGTGNSMRVTSIVASVVPVPAAVWLFGSGLLGLIGVAKRKKA